MIANLKLDTGLGNSIDGSRYLSILGSLLYLAIRTRPDIAFSVNFLARFSSKPEEVHWTALRHLLRYISGTKMEGIWFTDEHEGEALVTYCDANWGGDFHGLLMVFWYSFLEILSRGLREGSPVW